MTIAAAPTAAALPRRSTFWREARGVARFAALAGTGAAGVWIALQCVMWGFIYVNSASRGNAALNSAANANIALASNIADHVAHSANAVDTTLRLTRVALRAGAPLGEHAATPVKRGDLIRRLTRLDATGRVVASAPAQREAFARLEQQQNLLAHKAASKDVFLASSPSVDASQPGRTMTFSRPLYTESGVFDGALIASVDVDVFVRPYKELSLLRGGVALVAPERDILVRAGRLDLAEAHFRETPSEASCRRRAPARSLQDAIICGQSVDDLSVVIVASMAAVLKPVHHDQRLLSLGAALITIFSLPMLASSVLRRHRLYSAEAALERAQMRASATARDLRYALDNMSHGLMLLDAAGAIVLANNHAHRLLGFAPPELPPRHNDDLLRRVAAQPNIGSCLLQALQLNHPSQRVVCPGPGGRFLDVRTRRLAQGGYVRTLENVTRRHHDSLKLARARDEAEAASRARGFFLARMSHEIRTPLHAVIGFAQLLRARPLDSESAALLDHVSAASGHLIAVVDDVLDLSLVDAGQLRLREAPFNLNETLEKLRPIAAMASEGKPIAFRHVLDARTPAWIVGDERRLFQVLVNLVSNAHKFTDRGEVVVETTVLDGSPEPRLRIDVRDTGRGIDLTTVTELFGAFARGAGSEGVQGAGLGLAIVKHLVDLMSGELEVGCGAQGGASFAVVLPLRPAQPQQPPPALPVAPSLRVLVADDTLSSRLLAQALLEARGHCVEVVADGDEAIEACRRARFDLVLLDLQMPKMSGLEAAAAIGRMSQEWRAPYIAALTAQALAGDLPAIAAAGMAWVLRKPFNPTELDELLLQAARAAAPQAPNLV